jgi:hypothetical protein
MDAPAYLEMHRGSVLKVDRKGGSDPTIYVPRAALSIVGTIQPGVLARIIGREGRESGLLARLFVAMPRPAFARWTEADVDPETSRSYGDVIGKLLDLRPCQETGDPIELTLSPDARTRWRQFHDQMEEEAENATADLAAALAKLKGGAARIALVLALARAAEGSRAEDLREVDERAMEAGIAVATWFANEAERVYAVLGEGREESKTRRILEWIARRGGRVTARDLMRGLKPRPESAQAAEIRLRTLAPQYGRIQERQSGDHGGRPTIEFVLTGDTTPENGRADWGSVADRVAEDEGLAGGECGHDA